MALVKDFLYAGKSMYHVVTNKEDGKAEFILFKREWYCSEK